LNGFQFAGRARNFPFWIYEFFPDREGLFRFAANSIDMKIFLHVFLALFAVLGGAAAATRAQTPVAVTIPVINSGMGFVINVPVNTGSLAGKNALTYQFKLSYDPAVIQIQSPAYTTSTTLSGTAGMIIDTNPITPGTLLVSAYGPNYLDGAGTLLFIRFKVIGPTGSNSPLTLSNFMYNEGDPSSVTTNGLVNVFGPTAAGVSVGGRVMNSEGYGISKATVTIIDSGGEVRSAVTSPFGYYGFDDVAAGTTYTLTASAKQYSFSAQVVNVVDELNNVNFTAAGEAVSPGMRP
jgi:Carboxypeptidase regulatory-like domain/Cohesin domain